MQDTATSADTTDASPDFQLPASKSPPPTRLLLPKRPLTYDEVRSRVEDDNRLWNMDRVLPLDTLKATPTGHVAIPELGEARMTTWAKKQLAAILGIRWDRWFEKVSGQEAAQEINRRLSRTSIRFKLRTRRCKPHEVNGHDVMLAAIVSPSYVPIIDRRVVDSLAKALPTESLERLRFLHAEFTDQSSHLGAIEREPVSLDATDDRYFLGFYVRNSQVGFTALSIDVYLLRLVCANGLVASRGGCRVLYRTHRGIPDSYLHELVVKGFGRIPTLFEAVSHALNDARRVLLTDPEGFIKTTLKNSKTSLGRFVKPVHDLIETQGSVPSRFDVIQAITSVARGEAEPDVRYELERVAGDLLVLPSPPASPSAATQATVIDLQRGFLPAPGNDDGPVAIAA